MFKLFKKMRSMHIAEKHGKVVAKIFWQNSDDCRIIFWEHRQYLVLDKECALTLDKLRKYEEYFIDQIGADHSASCQAEMINWQGKFAFLLPVIES